MVSIHAPLRVRTFTGRAERRSARVSICAPVRGERGRGREVGADGVRPPDAQTPVGASRARPLAERRAALQTPRHRRRPIPPMRSHSLASWAAGFKSALTSRIRKLWNRPRAAVWQEDYFERIIRDEDELFRIREYILSNPARWKLDRENPEAGPGSEEEWPWNPDDDS